MAALILLVEHAALSVVATGRPAQFFGYTPLPEGPTANIATDPPLECRELFLTLEGDLLTAIYDVRVPLDHPIYQAVRRGEFDGRSNWFVHDVLGDVFVNQYSAWPTYQDYRPEWRLDFDDPTIESPADQRCVSHPADQGRIRLRASQFWAERGAVRLRVAEPGRHVKAWRDSVAVSAPALAVFSPDADVSRRDGPASTQMYVLERPAEADRDALLEVSGADAGAVRNQILGLAGGELVPVDTLLWKIGGLVPYVLVWWLIHAATRRGVRTGRRALRCVEALIGLAIAVGLLDALLELTDWIPAWRWYLELRGPAYLDGVPGTGIWTLVVVAALVWWPAAIHRSRSVQQPGLNRMHRVVVVGLTLLAALITSIAVALLYVQFGFRPTGRTALWSTGFGAGAFAMCYAASRSVFDFAKATLVALLSSGSVVALTMFSVFGRGFDARVLPTVCIAVVAVGMAVLAARIPLAPPGPHRAVRWHRWASVVGRVRATSGAAPIRERIRLLQRGVATTKPTRGTRWLRTAGVSLVRLPALIKPPSRSVRKPPRARRWPSPLEAATFSSITALCLGPIAYYAWSDRPNLLLGTWLTVYAADWLGGVAYYLLLAALVVTLAQVDRTFIRDDNSIQRLSAAAVAAAGFYWQDERLFYLPIAVMIGAVWTGFVTLTPARRHDRFTDRIAGLAYRMSAERRIALAAHKEIVDKLSMASTAGADVDTWEKQMAAREKLDELLRKIPESVTNHVLGGTTRQELQSRLTTGGMRHARYAALVGLVLGSPWMVIHIRQVLAAPPSPDDFPLLSYLGTTGWVLLQWPLYGFFFGYFYPYIRGNSGFPKSVSLFLAVCLPPLLFLLVWDRNDLWLTYAWATTQTLLFTSILGIVAGDGWLMRQVGLGPRQLLDAHRMRYVLAWGGTVGATLVGLVTAVLSGLLPVILEQMGFGGGPPPPGAR